MRLDGAQILNTKAGQSWLCVSRKGFEPKTHPPNTKKPNQPIKKTKIEKSFCVFFWCVRGFGSFFVFVFVFFLRKCIWLRATGGSNDRDNLIILLFLFSVLFFSVFPSPRLSLLLPHTRTNRTNLQTLKITKQLLLASKLNSCSSCQNGVVILKSKPNRDLLYED